MIGRVLGSARRAPVTIAITGLIAVVGVAGILGGSRGPFTLEALGLDSAGLRERHWWILVTSLISANGIVQLVIAVVAAALGLGLVERLMGSRRTLVAFAVTGVIASSLGVGFQLTGQLFGEFWSRSVNELDTVDPLTPIAGALGWASAWARPLWRRRLRVGLVAVALSMLLFSGQPADLYLVVAVVAGIWIGSRLRPGLRTPRSTRETRAMLALATAVMAVGPLLTLLSSTRYGVLSPLGAALTGGAPHGSSTCRPGDIAAGCVATLTHQQGLTPSALLVSLLPLVLTLVGAWGLLGGRRSAVALVTALSVVNGVAAGWLLGVAPLVGAPATVPPRAGHDWEFALWLLASTLIPLGFAVVMIVFRRSFPVRVPARRTMVAGAVAVGGVLLPLGGYLALGLLMPQAFTPRADALSLFEHGLQRLTPAEFLRHSLPTLVTHDAVVRWAGQVLGPLTWLCLIVAGIILVTGRRAVEDNQPDVLNALLAAGSGSLGHMSSWPGVRLWSTPDGRSGVPFRLVDGYAITVSDPIGHLENAESVLDGFLAHCDRLAWTPAFYSVHEEWSRRLRARGWTTIAVAEEAVIDPAAFQLSGHAMQEVRTSVNRAHRLGLSVLWTTWPDLGIRLAAQLDALSEDWVADRELPELGFTLGGADELRDPEVLLGIAFDASGRVLAATSWLPVTAGGRLVGRTLDFMRRRSDAPNGVMEYLIADGITRMAAQGLTEVSLSGSPLATSSAAAAAPATWSVDASLSAVGRMLEPAYGFRSLLRFKRKFGPEFRRLDLVVRDPVTLPAVGFAIARAYLPALSLRDLRRLLAAGR